MTFTVAEVLGGALHAATFDVTTHYPLVKSLTIDFVAPGTSPLTATATLSPDEIARVRAEATPDGKASFVLEAEVDRRGRRGRRPYPGRLPDPSLAALTRCPQRARCRRADAAALAPPMPCTPAPGGVAAEQR